MQYEVFISYASQDKEMVDRLAVYLEYYNISVFVAHRDIPADVAWANGIAEAIKYSRMAIALYSDTYNNAPWLDRELGWAQSSGVPILTVCLTSAPYSENKADFLQGTMCVDAVGDAEARFPIIYEEVCNMLGMPIEQGLPVDEVLKSAAPEVAPATESAGVVSKNEDSVDKPVAAQSHHLMRAFLIGMGLLAITMLLLESLLK